MTVDPASLSERLNRLVKLALDTGEATSLEEAETIFAGYRLAVAVGPDAARSPTHQAALLTIVNAARRSLLGGVFVTGALDAPLLVPFRGAADLAQAVTLLGGCLEPAPAGAPLIVLGDASHRAPFALRVTFQGWRAGCLPADDPARLDETWGVAPAGVLGGALAVSEVFQHLRGSNPRAGRRRVGLSLWRPEGSWLDAKTTGTAPARLPASAWIIGLGNLGQAYLWTLGLLPYDDPSAVRLVLQDFDVAAQSNESTSLLTCPEMLGRRKARAMGDWADARGFITTLVERRFGPDFKVQADEPSIGLCGVDNGLARSALEEVGFSRVFEAGLGRGVSDFLAMRLHSFPAARSARELWAGAAGEADSALHKPAYEAMARAGADKCGLTQLAGQTVGAPFVGAVAGTLVISELLRLVNGAPNYEVIDLHLRSPEHAVTVPQPDDFAFNPGGLRSMK